MVCARHLISKTETTPSGIISVINTEGKKHRQEAVSVHHHIRLSPNNAIVRTNFHCFAIDNTLVRLDFDNLGSGDLYMKLHSNLELFFHKCMYI